MLDLHQEYEDLKETIKKFDEEKEKLNSMQYDPTKCSILLNGVEIGASVDFKVYPSTPKVIILNAPASCVDADTEFFNGTGWKRIAEFEDGDTVLCSNIRGEAAYETPLFVKNIFEEDFIRLHRGNLDMVVTKDHDVVVKSSRGVLKKVKASDIEDKMINNKFGASDYYIPRSFSISCSGVDLSDDDIRLQVALTADSSVLKNGDLQLNIKKDRKKDRLRSLLQKTATHYKEYEFKSMPDYVRFVVKGKTKGFPEYFYQLSTEQNLILCEELLFWDGNQTECFFTTNKSEATLAQFCFTRAGFVSTIHTDNYKRVGDVCRERSVCYMVRKNKNSYTGLEVKRAHQKWLNYHKSTDKHSYCFTTKAGCWVARRSGNIFITGNCGKDVTAEYLVENLENTAHCEFKDHLFKLTKLIYQVSDKLWDSLYTRELKEVPSTYLEGLSPRQALIKVSEGVIKPIYGKDYFGKAALKQALNSCNNFGSNLCVFSDGGFIEELKPMLDHLGKDNILIVRIYRDGYTFAGDSRNYLPDSDDYNIIDLCNNGTLEDLFLNVKLIVNDFIGGKV